MTTIDAAGNAHRSAGAPGSAGGQFSGRANSAPENGLEVPSGLSEWTPADVDDALAELLTQSARAESRLDFQSNEVARANKSVVALETDPLKFGDDRDRMLASRRNALQRAEESEAEAAAEVERINGEMRPYEQEYQDRGGWTRAFLAASSTNPHVHRSMDCTTCNKMGQPTRFAWLTQYSGMDEDEIVEAAGERACTTCYPSAPVDVLSRPTTMFSEDEKRKAADRERLQVERARKSAEREAKSITSPDGTELREPTKYGTTVRTLVTAERELTGVLADLSVLTRPGHNPRTEYLAEREQWRDMLVAAIAAKKGIPESEVRVAGDQKAAAKLKREGW